MKEDLTFVEFSDTLASKAPTPGGGGASGAVGALSCALGQMVCNLTIGKKKYADVEDEVIEICGKLEELRQEMQELVDKDAAAFSPLAKAYSIPQEQEDRDEIMEEALRIACEPPMQIMEVAAKAIVHIERLAEIGSALAISDVGVAATFARAAMEGASLNVYINAASFKDRDYAEKVASRADELLATSAVNAQKAFDKVLSGLKG